MEEEETGADQAAKTAALRVLSQFQKLPRLVVFDLDYTLWPCYCEFYDESDSPPGLYPQAKGILLALREKGIDAAIASRSPTPPVARAFLAKLGIQSYFIAQEIYPSWTHKTEHFQRIQTATGLPFDSMLFFDDEDRNIQAVSKMGATSVLVGNGVNVEALRQGLAEFSRKSTSSED